MLLGLLLSQLFVNINSLRIRVITLSWEFIIVLALLSGRLISNLPLRKLVLVEHGDLVLLILKYLHWMLINITYALLALLI